MAGRSIHLFDHRAASVTENPENLHSPFNSMQATPAQHGDPAFTPSPHFWVSEGEIDWPRGLDWGLAFRDIARPTDVRTLIAAAVPKAAYSNKLPLLLPRSADWDDTEIYRSNACLWAANLCALVLDYV